jgi:acyl-CoA thioester hydrolase
MYQYKSSYRVSYGDTDQMGFMYYGHYARVYEIARTDSLRALGYTYKSMEESGVMMPVVDNYSKYIAPARYDDNLTITVFIKEMPDRRCIFEYEIHNEEGKLLNIGKTTLAFMDASTYKTTRVTAKMINLLKPFFA